MVTAKKLYSGAASFSLVACCAQAMRQVPLFSCTASCAARVFSGPLGEHMFFHMFRVRQHQKVFNSVVERVTVYVMDVGSFWGARYNPMFVVPHVRLCDLYKNVDEAFFRFSKAFGADRAGDSYFRDDSKFGVSYRVRERFVGAIRAAGGVLVGVSVFSLLANNLGSAKWA